MKVASHAAAKRRSVTLSEKSLLVLDNLRGSQAKSSYLEDLLERERARVKDEKFFTEINAAYTPAVCDETLRTNEKFPIHES